MCTCAKGSLRGVTTGNKKMNRDDGGSAFWSQFARKAVLHAREMERRERAEWWEAKKKQMPDIYGFCSTILSVLFRGLIVIVKCCILFVMLNIFILNMSGRAARNESDGFMAQSALNLSLYCETRWCGYIIPLCSEIILERRQQQWKSVYKPCCGDPGAPGPTGPQGIVVK